jgi:hypothetical protein
MLYDTKKKSLCDLPIIFVCMLNAFLLSMPMAIAKKMEEAPDPNVWLEELTANKQLKSTSFPHKIVFIRSWGVKEKEAPEFLNLDIEAFNKLGFFQAVDVRSVAWDYKLNPEMATKNPLVIISQLVNVDTFIFAPETGPWEFIRSQRGKRKVLAKVAGPEDTDPQSIYEWLPTALGWDGVVLAQRQDVLLVASTGKILAAPEIQALAVKDSENNFKLPKGRKGSGLLSLSRIESSLGIFDIIFLEQGVKTLPVGTKLIIEKKTKKAK